MIYLFEMVMCALYNKIKNYSILFKEFRTKFMNFAFHEKNAPCGADDFSSIGRAKQFDVPVYFGALGSAQNKNRAGHEMSVV